MPVPGGTICAKELSERVTTLQGRWSSVFVASPLRGSAYR